LFSKPDFRILDTLWHNMHISKQNYLVAKILTDIARLFVRCSCSGMAKLRCHI